MKEQIILDSREAEEIAEDFEGWAEVYESDPGSDGHPWAETMLKHARLLRDKLAGRIE
jgi:hypothetical protein